MREASNMSLRSRYFLKPLFVCVSQIVWQFIFVLSISCWRFIPSIPYFAKASDVLDRTRWFWLVDVPKPSLTNTSIIISLVQIIAFTEIISCTILSYKCLKSIWMHGNAKTKCISVVVVITGLLLSFLFEYRMYTNFIDMSEYYYLWQSIFSIEVYSIMAFLVWVVKIASVKAMR